MKDRKHLIFILTIIDLLLVSVFVFVLSVLALKLLIFPRKKEGGIEVRIKRSTQDYQSLVYDSTSGEIRPGIVSTYDVLAKDEFQFSRTEEGEYSLVSHFGMEEYECTGVCYCDVQRRVAGTGMLQKPIFYLAAATTSLIAIGLAKDYFADECAVELIAEGECDKPLIRSEVTDCKKAITDSEIYKEMDAEENEERWMCKGHCLPVDSLYASVELEGRNQEMFERVMDFKENERNPYYEWGAKRAESCFDITTSSEIRVPPRTHLKEVRDLYEKQVLSPLCFATTELHSFIEENKKLSTNLKLPLEERELAKRNLELEEHFVNYENMFDDEEDDQIDPLNPSWCTGHDFSMPSSNVRCRKISKMKPGTDFKWEF